MKQDFKKISKQISVVGILIFATIILLLLATVFVKENTQLEQDLADETLLNEEETTRENTEENTEESSEESAKEGSQMQDTDEYDYGTETGKVIIKYQDEDGNKIAEYRQIEGIIGKEYTTQRQEIDHYTSNGEEPFNKIGNYKKEDITVIYVYKLVSDAVHIEQDDNEITVKVENEKQNREYKLILRQETEDQEALTGGEFSLTNEQNEELVEGKTVNGELVLGSINVNKEETESYTITEEQSPKGYEKALKSANFSMKLAKKYNEEEKTYELTVTSENQELELEQTQDDEIIITAVNEKIKTYDLAIKKFVSSIDGEDTKRDVTARTDTEGNIVYDELNTNVEVKEDEKIVYTIRVFNEGDQQMQGKTITDTLPTGIEYIQDSEINKKYGWSINDNVITTDYLTEKTFEGIDIAQGETPTYEDIQIECKVTGENVNEDNVITNIVKIETDEKEKDTQDNEDECIVKFIPTVEEKYELGVKKFLSSVDGQELKEREITAQIVDGKIEYTQNSENYKVSNNQKLVYTIRIFNEGNIATTGRAIYEYIPQGLEFIEDSEINKENEWKMYKTDKLGNLIEVTDFEDATVIKTDKLENTEISGFDINNNETPKYVDVQVEFKVNEEKVTTEDRIITNVAKIEETRGEENPDNDESEEKVYVKQFDLEIIKYIKEITIKDDSGETTTEIGLAKKGTIFKKEINKKKINQTQVYVTYGLKIKNVGEIAGYATKIEDYIPNNFELNDTNNIWQTSDGKAVTTILANKIIEPGESKNLELSFKWDLNGSNLGERNNVAIIAEYKNDYDAKDNTPDKENEEKFIISIKTGAFEITIFILLAVLVIVAIIIKIKIRKRTNN